MKQRASRKTWRICLFMRKGLVLSWSAMMRMKMMMMKR